MKVSVLIPTYNRSHVLGSAIASVLDQTYRDFELLVADDGSGDRTAECVASFADSRVHYARQANGGIAAARNFAVSMADGEIVAFLDDDDIWKPEKLARTVEFLDRHPEADAVFTDAEKFDGSVFVPSFTRAAPVFGALLRDRSFPDGVVLDRRAMFLCNLQEAPILPSTLAVRRRALDQGGGFDVAWRSFEDWEFFIRFSQVRRIGYIDRPLTVIRVSPDSLHRVASVPGRLALIALLLRERKRHRHDRHVVSAIARGIAHQRTTMGWDYADAGRRTAALANYLRGFTEARDPRLLLRATTLWVPKRIADSLKRAARWIGLTERFDLLNWPVPAEAPRNSTSSAADRARRRAG